LRELVLPVGAISIVFVMLIPLPAPVVDALLALSMAAAVLVFLTAVQVRKAVELSVFPTLLLLLTLFRLSLNIASSRRILLHGSEGTAAAGDVIEAFGQFVVGGNYVVGFVLFLALIAIQFLVISHGAVRTAEVTARFTLDALPGKQMAIDADLNAGLIEEATARQRREAVAREAEFYGAMDGAARFNQRDSMATILLTAINIIAGLLIGTLQQNVPLLVAMKTYTILTVGDGLVTMIPSLLVSVAGGLVLTRASSSAGLGSELELQLFGKPKTLVIACAVLVAMAFIPGLPKVIFLSVAVGIALLARQIRKGLMEKNTEEMTSPKQKDRLVPIDNMASLLKLEELSLEIGFQLIPLVDESQGGSMLSRVRTLRRHLATELGFIIPAVHISDNLKLKPREYVISLRGEEIGRWLTEGNSLLAVNGEVQTREIPGKEAREPAFGVAARWIQPLQEDQALAAGYSVVDITTVISTHLSELIRRHAHELLTRTETKRILDSLNESHPKLLEELVPKVLSLGEVHKVLQQLLREQVSIRNLGTILEVLLENATASKNIVSLVEAVRMSLRRRIVQAHLEPDGLLHALLLDEQLEESVRKLFIPDLERMAEDGPELAQKGTLRQILNSVRSLTGGQSTLATPVLICSSPARYHLRRWLEPFMPKLVVLSPLEIPPEVRLKTVGVVR
jgi:flagellar biosynthesis protein FlhA